jgi:hypothetical protein
VVAAVVAGGLLGLVAAVSGGPLGGGHLATVGPDPLLVAGSATGTLAAGVAVGVVIGTVGAATARRRRG